MSLRTPARSHRPAAAFAGAVIATALLNVLLLWAPRPYLFFGWSIGPVPAAAALVPCTFAAELAPKVATCATNLAIEIGRSATQLGDDLSPYGQLAW
jgi:hypothetical protein